LIVLDLD